MDIADIIDYCLQKPGTSSDFPFGEDVLVIRVGGKMFALSNLKSAESINLKGVPTWNVEWRERFMEVQPGYHMNKEHWNTVNFKGRVSPDFLFHMIDISYALVYNSFSKKKREELFNSSRELELQKPES